MIEELLSPCGLMANSIFNDVILVTSGQSTNYHDLAWETDEDKFGQPEGFATLKLSSAAAAGGCLSSASPPSSGSFTASHRSCSDADCAAMFAAHDAMGASGGTYSGCTAYACPSDAAAANYYGCDAGAAYASWYPDDGATRYFYESFPEVTTPMAGIMNERFFVWMRAAVLPKFRKLYAVIEDDLAKGDAVTLSVTANFDVSKFEGTKSLVLTTTSWFGGKNEFLGNCFVVAGSMYLAFGAAFLIKQAASPRALGDTRFLEAPTVHLIRGRTAWGKKEATTTKKNPSAATGNK